MEEKKLTGYPSIDKPWLKFYRQESLGYLIPTCSIYEHLCNCTKNFSNLCALEYFGVKVSYAQLHKRIDQVANALTALGVKAGDIVSVCLPNMPEVVYSFYALNKIGAIANMLDPRCNESTLREQLVSANSLLLISLDSVLVKFNQILDQTPVKKVISVSAVNALPIPIQAIVKIKDPSLQVPIPKGMNVITWRNFIGNGKRTNCATPAVFDEASPAIIAYTGGTTGEPKGVIVTNTCLNAMVVQNAEMDYNVTLGDRCLDIAPPWTYYGLSNSLNAYLCMGLQVILIPKLGPDELGTLIFKHKPNHVITVPSALVAVMNCKELANENLEYLKTIIVGADKLDESFEIRFNEFLNTHNCKAVITKGYGMTEVTAAATYTKNNSNIIGSVGIPYIANTVSTFKTEAGNIVECKVGEQGEIAIHGPMLMKGYFGSAANQTTEILKAHADSKLWAHTGDIGHLDSDGRVYIDGRIKRMFVRNGFKIFPGMIEKIIMRHPGVENCAVIPIPDKENGCEIRAVIVRKQERVNSYDDIKEEIIQLCSESLYDYEIPGNYVFTDKLPLTGMGKIDYRTLEKEAAQMTSEI